jgi:ribosomal subunit interface protein
MNIQHLEKGFYYSDKELVKIAAKLGKLATYCQRIKNPDSMIRVDAVRQDTKKEKDQIKVTITVTLPKKEFHAETFQQFAIEGIDRCIEKLTPQIIKYKELHTGKERARKSR